MTQGSRVSDNAGNQNGGGVNSVTTVDNVYAEFRCRQRVTGYFRAGAEDIHEDTGAMGYKRGKRNNHVFMHEIELKRYYEKQNRRTESQIQSNQRFYNGSPGF